MSNKTILIIDDHKDFREMIRVFIQKKFKDVNIKEAGTGEEGVEVALKEKPTVSLIDIRLPGIDGIETARQIKQSVHDCDIIMMSMFEQNSLQALVQQKNNLFINKDHLDSKLIPVLNKLLMADTKHKLGGAK